MCHCSLCCALRVPAAALPLILRACACESIQGKSHPVHREANSTAGQQQARQPWPARQIRRCALSSGSASLSLSAARPRFHAHCDNQQQHETTQQGHSTIRSHRGESDRRRRGWAQSRFARCALISRRFAMRSRSPRRSPLDSDPANLLFSRSTRITHTPARSNRSSSAALVRSQSCSSPLLPHSALHPPCVAPPFSACALCLPASSQCCCRPRLCRPRALHLPAAQLLRARAFASACTPALPTACSSPAKTK